MQRILVLVIALVASAAAQAAPPLLGPADLNALLGKPGVRVIDIRVVRRQAHPRRGVRPVRQLARPGIQSR
jgi:hypothetical protein